VLESGDQESKGDDPGTAAPPAAGSAGASAAPTDGAGDAAAAGNEDEDDEDDDMPEPTITVAALSPLQQLCVGALEVDGEACYEFAGQPQFLLAATSLLRVLADTTGEGLLAMTASRLSSVPWWCVRSVVAHQRSLAHDKPAASLWDAAVSNMRRAAAVFASDDVELVEKVVIPPPVPHELTIGEDGSISEPVSQRMGVPQISDDPPAKPEKLGRMSWSECMHAGLMLEWAVAQRLFGRPDDASKSLLAAKAASGLKAKLTGSRGKKTKCVSLS